MKWIKYLAIFLATALVGFFGLQYAASETTGEVVVLTTTDKTGTTHETRLWVVDNDGSAWLRAGMGGSAWYARMLQHPTVTLLRNGQHANYTAVPTPAATTKIAELIKQKYGWGEKFISSTLDRSTSVAIRLQPES